MIWSCPICQKTLNDQNKSVACENGHQFDRAKQGYLPLLPAQHKRSAVPGDDRAMLLARRDFLQAGFYQPLADLLADTMIDRVHSHPTAVSCLDTGCGEGYYLNYIAVRMASASLDFEGYGCDIAKEAVRLASSSYKNLQFAVASNFKLPVISSSVAVVLRIFAPGDDNEVVRILSPEGEFWRVVPGENHLQELKSRLYDNLTTHSLPQTPEGFEEIEQLSLGYLISLPTNASVHQLLQMTPFAWQGSAEKQTSLRSLDKLQITASFVLQRYRARK